MSEEDKGGIDKGSCNSCETCGRDECKLSAFVKQKLEGVDFALLEPLTKNKICEMLEKIGELKETAENLAKLYDCYENLLDQKEKEGE